MESDNIELFDENMRDFDDTIKDLTKHVELRRTGWSGLSSDCPMGQLHEEEKTLKSKRGEKLLLKVEW